jgi:putative nucleotide binding protein
MTDEDDDGTTEAVVLDLLPNGRPDDDRPAYQKQPVAFVVGVDDFRLFELAVAEDGDVSIGDRLAVTGDRDPRVDSVRRIGYDDLTGGARSELEYAITELIEDEERRFVDFYNDAQAITTRLHALNLLPGIGKKLRNNILDERKRGPFESFEDLEERVSGLHRPREIIADRIMEEIREDEMKYRIFARRSD